LFQIVLVMEDELSNSTKNGILYLEDEMDKVLYQIKIWSVQWREAYPLKFESKAFRMYRTKLAFFYMLNYYSFPGI
jgi:hypothetical protein